MALAVRQTGPLEHSDATWVVHVVSVVSLLIGGAYWWTVLLDPFFDFPVWCGPLAGACFFALAVIAVVRPGLAHSLVWLLVAAVPIAAFVAEPFGWGYVGLVTAVFSVPCSVCGALLHSTMRRLAADSLARRA